MKSSVSAAWSLRVGYGLRLLPKRNPFESRHVGDGLCSELGDAGPDQPCLRAGMSDPGGLGMGPGVLSFAWDLNSSARSSQAPTCHPRGFMWDARPSPVSMRLWRTNRLDALRCLPESGAGPQGSGVPAGGRALAGDP